MEVSVGRRLKFWSCLEEAGQRKTRREEEGSGERRWDSHFFAERGRGGEEVGGSSAGLRNDANWRVSFLRMPRALTLTKEKRT